MFPILTHAFEMVERLHVGLFDYARYVLGCAVLPWLPWQSRPVPYKDYEWAPDVYLELFDDLWHLYGNLYNGLR